MRGRKGEEERRSSWHMWSVPAHGKAATPTQQPPPIPLVTTDIDRCSHDFFLKDGRKIRVGDCALFQSGNSPAFIGIIRWFSSGKEGHLKLGVNWLYRPADVKLAKGILLEAAPNEVFYSFHKDEISAESLLHPCKVAFLRKGVELASGTSSFVCRRVYDIANKCLWWLTDQDYINERQEEVDQLLDKTRLEMHAAVQSGGRSPKRLNGPSSMQQLKSGSDSVQNSGSSASLQGKGKKKEKLEQGLETIKKEHLPKADNGDHGNGMFEGKIKTEVAKITDKGALISNEGVEKLVHLMQLDRGERKIDLPGRILLADVISSTDRFDCLGRFVQLKGLLVLDDWLQEAHKGKIGDCTSPKESDKSVEDLLLALLRALDKLPVNLQALQISNIGKSVNHLRSHKNPEIQKRARSLVDTWKKRVDIEMTKINDAKSGGSSQAIAWSGKPGISDVCHGVNRHTATSEVAMKSSPTQSSTCKNVPTKPSHGDVKSPPVLAGSSKLLSAATASLAVCSKDGQSKTAGISGSAELQLSTIKEEKSSGSSQSQNNSQSCSSGHAKATGTLLKEDAKSSTAGSMRAHKNAGGVSRQRKSNNGILGSSVSGSHKEANLVKTSPFNRNTASSKSSQSGLASERLSDLPVSDHGNSHRLIVRLPNPGRSPARSTSGGSFEEPATVSSRASSPGAFEKHDQNDPKMKIRGSPSQAIAAAGINTESWSSNNIKGTLSREGDKLSSAPNEVHEDNDENGKMDDEMKPSGSSPSKENQPLFTDSKSGKPCESTFTSMNALIESCVKYSDSTSLAAGDDLGMNLLASVATGEICKSDLVSPTISPLGSSPVPEEPSNGTEAKLRFSSPSQHDDLVNEDSEKIGINSSLHGEESKKRDVHGMPISSCDGTNTVMPQEHKSTEHKEVGMNLRRKSDEEALSEGKTISTSSPRLKGDDMEIDEVNNERMNPEVHSCDGSMGGKCSVRNSLSQRFKSADCGPERMANVALSTTGKTSEKEAGEELPSGPSNMDIQRTHVVNEVSNIVLRSEENVPSDTVVEPDTRICTIDALGSSGSAIIDSKHADRLMPGNADAMCTKVHPESSDSGKEQDNLSPSLDHQVTVIPVPLDTGNVTESAQIKEAVMPPAEEVLRATTETEQQHTNSMDSRTTGHEEDEIEERASSADAPLPDFAGSFNTAKHGFDLNEGIPGEDINQEEPAVSAPLRCVPMVSQSVLTSLMVSPLSNDSPVPVTIAAPAKGPFLPRENLFVCKGELGWKGSAATSAFRPAEPRKALEMPLSTSEAPSDINGKQIRPALNIDLNVPDEHNLEDNASQDFASESGIATTHDVSFKNVVGLDLDLNKVDDVTDNGQPLASSARGSESTLLPIRLESMGFSNGEANALRDFDLNGPGFDEVGVEPVSHNHHTKISSVSLPAGGLRMNNTELGNMSSWFPVNAFPAVAIPPFMSDRGDQTYPIVPPAGAQRFLGSASGSFGGDIYRSPVLSSSPAMSFPPAATFPYVNFPFGSSFPLPSSSFTGGSAIYVDSSSCGGPCYPPIPSHLGSTNAAASAYIRPSVMNLQECSTSGGGSDGSRKWGRQNLDLNAGPGSVDMEGREERLVSASRQHFVASSHAFAEEQARTYQVASGSLKRKEPEGGWDAEKYTYKQPSWQ